MRYLVIADDLTGALEIGVLARGAGWRSLVLRQGTPLRLPDAQFPVVVVDTGSREMPEVAAREAIQTLLAGVPDDSETVLLKKTDSLLRGNIAAELAELAAARPQRQIVYVPAYPLMGRTVAVAKLRAEGIDALPWDGDLRAMLGDVPQEREVHVIPDEAALRALLVDPMGGQGTSSPPPLLLCDAQRQGQVDAMAETLCHAGVNVMTAGPAGVFRAFFSKPDAVLPPVAIPRIPVGVAVVGSQHEVSLAQCAAAKAAGCVVLLQAADANSQDYQRLRKQANTQGKWLLLQAASSVEAALMVRVGSLAGGRGALPPAMYFSGGSTADACLGDLGCTELEPLAELLPGVVLSQVQVGEHDSSRQDSGDQALLVITKSGAFGDPRTLVELLAMLQGKL